MWQLWLVVLFAGCASFVPDPGDPLTRAPDQRVAMDDAGPADLRREVDLSTVDLRPAPVDFAGFDLLGAYSHPRVSEVAPGAGGVTGDEFIELAGASVDVALKDFKLNYQAPTGGVATLLVFGDVTLPKGGYLLIAASGTPFAAKADAQFSAGASGRLGKDGGAVGLVNAAGVRVDSLAWGATARDYVEGKAAPAPGEKGCSRFPDGVDTDHNDLDAHTAELTPRAQNR